MEWDLIAGKHKMLYFQFSVVETIQFKKVEGEALKLLSVIFWLLEWLAFMLSLA